MGLGVFHLVCFLTLVLFRNNVKLLITAFFFFGICTLLVDWHTQESSCFLFLSFSEAFLVFMSETLNSLGAEHWRSFATQAYFDESGFFLVVIYATPLLFNAFLALVHLLSSHSSSFFSFFFLLSCFLFLLSSFFFLSSVFSFFSF